MQTFIPVATFDYRHMAKVLDNKRLNKQALEAWQILMTLTKLDPAGNHREPKGWVNHPAVKMWRGYEHALAMYALAMVDEWKSRGFNSTIDGKVRATLDVAKRDGRIDPLSASPPMWLIFQGNVVATTHRLALLVKDYEWYSKFGWDEDPGYPPTEYEYIWPVK
jgi:hypothetical protein